MNKNELKKFVRKVLLERLNESPRVTGKLVKKTISFSGIARDVVCEGTIEDANKFAIENELEYKHESDSYFGGHYTNEMTSYEFHADPDFYGELMEANMSTREQLSRICGDGTHILTEVDAHNSEKLVDYIYESEDFKENFGDLVFEHINNIIENKLYDKTSFKGLFEYLVKQASILSETDVDLNYTTRVLSKRFFDNVVKEETTIKPQTKCGKKSFTSGTAFENMKRISTGHNMFL